MRLPTSTLIFPAAALIFIFSPDAQAANPASAGLHAQTSNVVHPVAQKHMKSATKPKLAIHKPKAKAKAGNY